MCSSATLAGGCLISSSYILIPFSPFTSILDIKHIEEIDGHSHMNINNPSSFQGRLFSSQCAMRQTDRRLILPVIGNFALSDLDFGQHCPVRRRSRTWRSPPASLCHIFLSFLELACADLLWPNLAERILIVERCREAAAPALTGI